MRRGPSRPHPGRRARGYRVNERGQLSCRYGGTVLCASTLQLAEEMNTFDVDRFLRELFSEDAYDYEEEMSECEVENDDD